MSKDRTKTRFNRRLKCGLPMYDGIVASNGKALPNPTACFAFWRPKKGKRRLYAYRKQEQS
jgi:hypothetical protein